MIPPWGWFLLTIWTKMIPKNEKLNFVWSFTKKSCRFVFFISRELSIINLFSHKQYTSENLQQQIQQEDQIFGWTSRLCIMIIHLSRQHLEKSDFWPQETMNSDDTSTMFTWFGPGWLHVPETKNHPEKVSFWIT
jgi:hypothetical protein